MFVRTTTNAIITTKLASARPSREGPGFEWTNPSKPIVAATHSATAISSAIEIATE
jgi:hypothetical protein